MKILVVDDNLELLGLIGFALRQAGYLVLESADGGAALAVFAREQPDLVILDVEPADAERLRGMPAHPGRGRHADYAADRAQ